MTASPLDKFKKMLAMTKAKAGNPDSQQAEFKLPENGVVAPSFKIKGPVEEELIKIKEQLRSLEDIELVTKLEGIRTQDDIAAFKVKLEETKKKVDVLAEAVQTLTQALSKKIELKELRAAVTAPPPTMPQMPGYKVEIPSSLAKKVAEMDELAGQLKRANTRIEELQAALRDVQKVVAVKVTKEGAKGAAFEGVIPRLFKPKITPIISTKELSAFQAQLKELSSQTRAKLDELEYRLKEELGVKGMRTVTTRIDGLTEALVGMRRKVEALDTSLAFLEQEMIKIKKVRPTAAAAPAAAAPAPAKMKISIFGRPPEAVMAKQISDLRRKVEALDASLRFTEQEVAKIKGAPRAPAVVTKAPAKLAAIPTPPAVPFQAIKDLKDKLEHIGFSVKDMERKVAQIREKQAQQAQPPPAPPAETVQRLKRLESEISVYKPELARLRADIMRVSQQLEKVAEKVATPNVGVLQHVMEHSKERKATAKLLEESAKVRKEFATLKGQFTALSNRMNQALMDLKAVRTNFGVIQDGYDAMSKQQSEALKEIDLVKEKLLESVVGLQASINSVERRLEPLSKLENWVSDRVYRYEDSIKQLQMDLMADFIDLEQRLKKEDDFVRKTLADEDAKLKQEIAAAEGRLKQEIRDANMVMTGRIDQLSQKVEPLGQLEGWIADKVAAHEKEDRLLHQKIEEAESNLVAKIEAAEEKAMGEISKTRETLTSEVSSTEERAVNEMREVEEKMVSEIQALEAGKVVPAIEERLSPISKEIGALKTEIENIVAEKAELVGDVERILLKQEEQIIKRVHFDELRRDIIEKTDSKLAEVVEKTDSKLAEVMEKVGAKIAELSEKIAAAEAVIRRAEEKIETIDQFVSTAIEKAIGTRVEALERERDYFRTEFMNLKNAYFRLAEEERIAPLVIE